MDEKKEMRQIDLVRIFRVLWQHRKKYFVVMPTVLVLTYLLTLCVPRYYRCEVSIAPESTGNSGSSSLGSLASSFGLGSLSKLGGNNDAINVEIYPNILSSKDFIVTLMPVEVKNKDGENLGTYYTYLRDKQSVAPWSAVMGWVMQLFKPAPHDTYTGKEQIKIFNLTKRQSEIFDGVAGKIKCNVDKKTDVATITVEDQDPVVAATIADATCRKLQEFIVVYRTKKARIDYEYYKKLCAQAKVNYDRIRQSYGAYSDANEDVVLKSYHLKADDMENEMQLKYNIYTAMNSQLQAAQAKLQEATPAFTVLESASVPVKPVGPKRMLTSLIMMILSFVVISVWVLTKNGGIVTKVNE